MTNSSFDSGLSNNSSTSIKENPLEVVDIAIKVENLTKVYKLYKNPIDRLKESLHWRGRKYHTDFYALDKLNFEIKKGETVGIIGKNGSGKSTLLKILTGVLSATSGKVVVNGKVAALLELGAGFNPEYTGIENIFFQGTLMGYTQHEIQAKLEDILTFADIGEFVHQKVKMYSSGMFARLAFAVAINVEPDILIVDEALSVGDMAFQSRCFNKFKQFREKGITILFVTHSVDTVIKYCQSAMLINDGVKVRDGNSKDIVELFRKLMVDISRNKNKLNDKEVGANAYIPTDRLLKDMLPLNYHANSYGNMDAEIIDFAIINADNVVTNHLYHGDSYTIELIVKFSTDVVDPIFAFTLRGVDGLELTGSNSLILNHVTGIKKAGEVARVKFTQIMILNSGQYYLALGCTQYNDNNLTVLNRIYDAVLVNVISLNSGVGIAYTISDLEINSI